MGLHGYATVLVKISLKYTVYQNTKMHKLDIFPALFGLLNGEFFHDYFTALISLHDSKIHIQRQHILSLLDGWIKHFFFHICR